MTDEKYHLAARLMHWIMAVSFVFMWGCGYAMTTLVQDDSPLEEFLFDLLISVGVTLLALLILRIAVRLAYRPPPLPLPLPLPLPAMIRGMERTAAHLGHAALYALPALVIAAGWAQIDFRGHGVCSGSASRCPGSSPRWGRICRTSPKTCTCGSPTPCWRSPPVTSRRRSSRDPALEPLPGPVGHR